MGLTLNQGRQRFRLRMLWYLAIVLCVVLFLQPINYGIMRLGILILGLIIWLGALLLFWKHKVLRVISLILTAFLIALIALPGRPVDVDILRDIYVQELERYEGSPYIWGGENQLGIDCSGLVRQGLIYANFKQGLISMNPDLIRRGISLWWYDAAANALRDEYRNYTRRGLKYNSINEVDHSQIQKGDMAVTLDGEHILAYMGNQTWIQADPGYLKVIKVRTPEPENVWFRTPVYVLHWQQFE